MEIHCCCCCVVSLFSIFNFFDGRWFVCLLLFSLSLSYQVPCIPPTIRFACCCLYDPCAAAAAAAAVLANNVGVGAGPEHMKRLRTHERFVERFRSLACKLERERLYFYCALCSAFGYASLLFFVFVFVFFFSFFIRPSVWKENKKTAAFVLAFRHKKKVPSPK